VALQPDPATQRGLPDLARARRGGMTQPGDEDDRAIDNQTRVRGPRERVCSGRAHARRKGHCNWPLKPNRIRLGVRTGTGIGRTT
jgi:hypothetical protein